MPGRFITFEGGEGAGKSTQIARLARRLSGFGLAVRTTREPGGSPGAEAVRHVVLSGAARALGADTEALLFAAARIDHVETVIRPLIASGVWVLCDRFTDSTRVYQGASGVAPALIGALERLALGHLAIDLTIIIDVPVEIGLSRAAVRRGSGVTDRFEADDIEVHRQRRDAYLAIAAAEPERCVVVDGSGSPDAVEAQIWAAVTRRWGGLGWGGGTPRAA